LVLRCRGARLAASLARPEGTCRAAVAALHPADDPSRRQFLFEHLAMVLPEHGVAVLRYDRRPAPPGRDVPYELQAEDLAHGLAALAEVTGPVPTGLWGFSQGAWVALLAAARRADIAFLVLIGCSAVSPARQMQYGTAEQLRRAGFGPGCQAELARLRAAYEGYQRGQLTRPRAQQVVDAYADRAWFGLSWVPRVLPEAPDWDDMDFDPAASIAQVRCPVLAFYGADEWGPGAGEHRRLAGRVRRSGPAGHPRARRDHSSPDLRRAARAGRHQPRVHRPAHRLARRSHSRARLNAALEV
jgi:uncharacterized protein